MYIPSFNREDDVQTLHEFMRTYSFATLITQHEGTLLASHLPFTLNSERGRYGVLACHFARANSQWRTLDPQQEILVIFQGPHAYISPSWYGVHPSVPTWNYAVVHAYGLPRIIDDEQELYEMLRVLVQTNEAGFAQQWHLQPIDDYLHKMMRAVVGVEIEITRLEGKYKLSQNRTMDDQLRVIEALAASPAEEQRQVADLMRRRLQ